MTAETFPETIPDLLAWRAAAAAATAAKSAAWLGFESDTWSLSDVLVEVDRIAVGLAEHGVTRGDRVAILCGNRPETIFAWFAANQLGAIAMPLNPAYKAPELEGVLALTTPRVMIASDDLRSLAEAAHASPITFSSSTTAHGKAPAVSVAPDDVAVLLATSGTTGAPKAVMQTHRTYTLTAEAFPWWLGLDASDRFFCTLPLFHINAQAYSTMGSLGCGAALSLTSRFSASRFWDTVRAERSTTVNAVGAMIHILLRADASQSDRDHHLRVVYSALALPEALHRAFEERFGVKMIVGYGLSETTFGTVWPLAHHDRSPPPPPYGTMGVLRQHPRLGAINRARVVDGEIHLSNPAMMRGYYGDEAQTRAAFDGEWFKTGDLVTENGDGTFTFVSRKKEMLRRRGENISAAEIEAALTAHPSVKEAAVIGVASDLGEDDLVAFVVGDAPIDIDALKAFVRDRLADYKVPQRIHVRDALPRTATERIAKHLLREDGRPTGAQD